MSTSGRKKRIKGEPVHWDELKKPRTINLTDTAWDNLKIKGDDLGVSRSEMIERWSRTAD